MRFVACEDSELKQIDIKAADISAGIIGEIFLCFEEIDEQKRLLACRLMKCLHKFKNSLV